MEPEIANPAEAPAEGEVQGGEILATIAELQRRAHSFRATLGATPLGRPWTHPNLAMAYREKVTRLRDAIAGDGGAEALEAARSLIDKVIVSPRPKGRGPPRIELIGDLPEMLKAAAVPPTGPASFDL